MRGKLDRGVGGIRIEMEGKREWDRWGRGWGIWKRDNRYVFGMKLMEGWMGERKMRVRSGVWVG